MPLQLNDIAHNLCLNEHGIYTTGNFQPISYPEKGNEYCFELEDNSFWFQHRSSCIAAAVEQFVPNSIFFDVGGGNGYVTKSLQNKKIKTVLIEPGNNGVLNAKQRGVQNIIRSNFKDIAFKKNAVKAVGLFDVLEHVENDIGFLEQIKSVLPKEALIFITVPAYSFLWSNDDVQAGHFRRYTLKSLEKLLRSQGCSVVRKSYLFSFLILPIFLMRTIPSIFKKTKKAIDFSKHQNIHQPDTFTLKIIDNVLNRELDRFKQGYNLKLGSSCFIVAKVN